MSPAFPTGSFAYSHGLEWAIESRIVTTAAELTNWLEELLTRGSAWNDAVLFSQCWTGESGDLNNLAIALASSRERYLETTQLGSAFERASQIFSGSPPAEKTELIAYPIAAGCACFAAGVAKGPALLAFLQGFAAALVSVAVRLVPLGQTQGLHTLRDLLPVIELTAARAAAATLDDLGAVTFSADIASMNHEIQHSRIFRS